MPAIARVRVEGLKAAEFANFFEARQVRSGCWGFAEGEDEEVPARSRCKSLLKTGDRLLGKFKTGVPTEALLVRLAGILFPPQ